MSKLSNTSVTEDHIAPLDPETMLLVEHTIESLKPLVDYIELPWYRKLFVKRPQPKETK